jgi:hypothetical protein
VQEGLEKHSKNLCLGEREVEEDGKLGEYKWITYS